MKATLLSSTSAAFAVLVSTTLIGSSAARADGVGSPGIAASGSAEGLVVVASGRATDAAWPLAKSVYGSGELQPSAVDEASARVLCGEQPARDASVEMRDLAAEVAAVHGDDAASRTVLADIARRTRARAVAVVSVEGGPTARVFLAESSTFDAARYAPDDATALSWTATTRSLVRAFGAARGANSAPRQATQSGIRPESKPSKRRAFYESYWFWGGLAAAAAVAGVVALTQDNGATMVHLHLNVPQ